MFVIKFGHYWPVIEPCHHPHMSSHIFNLIVYDQKVFLWTELIHVIHHVDQSGVWQADCHGQLYVWLYNSLSLVVLNGCNSISHIIRMTQSADIHPFHQVRSLHPNCREFVFALKVFFVMKLPWFMCHCDQIN